MSGIGPLLKHWRNARRLSQLSLAVESAVSVRHLSFIETGRASPSRAMVLRLSEVLDVPLRDRNALLVAAGFAPVYQESALEAPALAAVSGALDAILAQQEPFPALVIDRSWDIRRTNAAAERFFAFLTAGATARAPGPPNVLRRIFHPDGLRPHVRNWDDVAQALVRRARREAIGGVADERARRILDEVLAYPGVPAALRHADATAPTLPIVPVRYARDGRRFDYFSTVTTLGTAQDVTLQELRIECFFPADEATRAEALRLVSAQGAGQDRGDGAADGGGIR
jgi:transcriptional regulator with XRE-family HTH domain